MLSTLRHALFTKLYASAREVNRHSPFNALAIPAPHQEFRMKIFSSALRFKFSPFLLAAGLGLAAAGASYAGEHRGQHDPVARMSQHLSLDETQKASVTSIFERGRPAQQALRERSKKHHEAMKALDPKAANYSTRAQALADEAGTLARDRVLQRTQLNAELATVLSAEQMSKMKERKGRGHRGGGHRKGPKPAPEAAS